MLNKLPVEVMMMILNLLTLSDLKQVKLVCQQMSDMVWYTKMFQKQQLVWRISHKNWKIFCEKIVKKHTPKHIVLYAAFLNRFQTDTVMEDLATCKVTRLIIKGCFNGNLAKLVPIANNLENKFDLEEIKVYCNKY